MSVKLEKLLAMAEQISDNMRFTEDAQQVAEKIADHLNRFWDPRMRQTLRDYGKLIAEQTEQQADTATSEPSTEQLSTELSIELSKELRIAIALLNP